MTTAGILEQHVEAIDSSSISLMIREAIELHVTGLREDGLPVPEPSSQVEYVEITA